MDSVANEHDGGVYVSFFPPTQPLSILLWYCTVSVLASEIPIHFIVSVARCMHLNLTELVSHKITTGLCEKQNSYSIANTFSDDKRKYWKITDEANCFLDEVLLLRIFPGSWILQIHLVPDVWCKDEHRRGLSAWPRQFLMLTFSFYHLIFCLLCYSSCQNLSYYCGVNHWRAKAVAATTEGSVTVSAQSKGH